MLCVGFFSASQARVVGDGSHLSGQRRICGWGYCDQADHRQRFSVSQRSADRGDWGRRLGGQREDPV